MPIFLDHVSMKYCFENKDLQSEPQAEIIEQTKFSFPKEVDHGAHISSLNDVALARRREGNPQVDSCMIR